jgi:hypothetical protein
MNIRKLCITLRGFLFIGVGIYAITATPFLGIPLICVGIYEVVMP